MKMNNPQKIAILIILLGLSVLLFDLEILRGHLLSKVISVHKMGEMGEGNINMEYHIKRNKDGTYKFQITNKSILPKFIILYRDNELFYELSDSMLLHCAMRAKLSTKNWEREQSYGFDCGTGLGDASINPFETFTMEKDEAALLKYYSLLNDLTVISQNGVCDPFYWKPIVSNDENGNWRWNKLSPITIKDSLDVQFYLPVHSIVSGKQHHIYSNPIKLAYLDLVEEQLRRKRR